MIFGKNNWIYWYSLMWIIRGVSAINTRAGWWISDKTGMTDRLGNLLGIDIRADRDKPD